MIQYLSCKYETQIKLPSFNTNLFTTINIIYSRRLDIITKTLKLHNRIEKNLGKGYPLTFSIGNFNLISFKNVSFHSFSVDV